MHARKQVSVIIRFEWPTFKFDRYSGVLDNVLDHVDQFGAHSVSGNSGHLKRTRLKHNEPPRNSSARNERLTIRNTKWHTFSF